MSIPDSVITIGEYVFFNCTELKTAAIGNSVTAIGEGAFRATALTSVAIPKSVTSIGSIAFSPCTALARITVDPLNPAYSSMDGVLFNKDKTVLIQYPGGKFGSYIIPNSVTSISYSAFQVCVGLTSIIIPNSATPIARNTFYGCTSLTDGTYRNGLARAGYRMNLLPHPAWNFQTGASAMALSGNYAYVSDSASSLRVFDFTDLNAPQLIATLPWEGPLTLSIKASGNRIYQCADGIVRVIDVSNPKSPIAQAEIEYDSGADMDVAGNLLAVVTHERAPDGNSLENHLRIVNLTTPSAPAAGGELYLDQSVTDHAHIRLSVSHAFITVDSKMYIVDVGNPSAPHLLGTYSTTSEGEAFGSLATSGNNVFVQSRQREAPWASSIHVVDVTDPAHPTAAAIRRHRFSDFEAMHLAGSRLYLHHHESWMPGEYDFLTVLDITKPGGMFEVGAFEFESRYFRAMAANEQSVFLDSQGFRPEFSLELGMQARGGQIELNWPNVDATFKLQQKVDLNSAGPWTNVLSAPSVTDGQNYLSVPADGNPNFFRLAKP